MTTLKASMALLGLLALGLGLAMAELDPSNNLKYCTWLAKRVVSGQESCLTKCHDMCNTNPGEYLCSGQLVHNDTAAGKKYDTSDARNFTYCFCHRSVVTRLPGLFCGPKSKACPIAAAKSWTKASPAKTADLSPGEYVDGLNTMIPGHQGLTHFTIAPKLTDGVYDTDVACDNELYGKLRYMFQ